MPQGFLSLSEANIHYTLILNSDFLQNFSQFYTCRLTPGRRHITHKGQNFNCSRKLLLLRMCVSSVRGFVFNSDFIYIKKVCHDFQRVYRTTRTDNTFGTKKLLFNDYLTVFSFKCVFFSYKCIAMQN